MSKVVADVAIGAGLIAGSFFIPGFFVLGGYLISGSALSTIIATAGAGMVLSGVGTLLEQKANGIATMNRNPIQPWQIIFGTSKVGATVVYQEEVGSSNRILLLVLAVAAHPCNALTEIWFNNRALQLETDFQNSDESNPNGFLQSFDPPQGNWQIETISRVNDVVTFVFAQNPNSLLASFDGQTMHIHGTADANGLASLDGYFTIAQLGPNLGSYTCGGPQGDGRPGVGTMTSTWPQYGNTVVAGYYLGDQTEVSGIVLGNSNGYWTEDCLLSGLTYVSLKLLYDSTRYTGLPEISFVVSGKNDIYDPRTKTRGFSANPALCIADYLSNPLWGYNCAYDDQADIDPSQQIIPTTELIAAANLCDERVQLALGGSEARYECHGAFSVDTGRGDVLQNLLTSCAGRLLELGGSFYIQPGAWYPPVGAITVSGCSGAPKMMMSSVGLVPEFFNSPTSNTYVPSCAGTNKSQFIYALGMLQAYQATGDSNALAQAKMALGPIISVLFRGIQPPANVTADTPWTPNCAFGVKQAFLGDNGVTISPTEDFASDFATPAGWRALTGLEVQTNGDAYNLAIRLFGLAAQVIDGAFSTTDPDLGYSLSPYGSSYGDPPVAGTTVNSQYLAWLNAILKMASIAYKTFSSAPGVGLEPDYYGSAVTFAVEFTGTPAALSSFVGPYYTGYQSPWAVRQMAPTDTARIALAVQFLSQSQNQQAAQQTMPDTVVFTVTGANPQTFSAPIQINTGGVAAVPFTYEGHNVGVDTIVATLASHSLTSNAAKIEWSAYAKPIAVYGVQITVMQADGTSLFNGLSTVLAPAQTVLGLMFNSHPSSIFPGDPHDSGNQANPFVSNTVNTSSQYAGDVAIAGTSGPFNAAITFGFTVDAAGDIPFSAYVNSRFIIGVQGMTYVSGEQNLGPMSTTAQKGYTSQVGNNSGDWPGGNWQQVDFTLHAPAPGLYQGEIDFASGLFGEREFALIANGFPIPSITLASGTGATATGTPPSGQIQLTPYSGGAAIGNNATFFLEITGITYTGPGAGPFVPVYYRQTLPGELTWGVSQTWGYVGPDPNATAGYYQYRPFAEMADLIGICDGAESYYAQAQAVATTFASWLVGAWTNAVNGPPNYFPQTGPQITKQDVHCAALILHAAIALDTHARPTGAGTINSNVSTLINHCYAMFGALYLSSGPMAGTFCLNASGAQDWSPIWHGELLRSLSMLVTWGRLANQQPAMVAQAIIWLNGLVNFSLDNVVIVDQDLGYTIDDMTSGIVWKPKLSRTDQFNGIKGTYISPSNKWQQADIPPYAQDQIHGYTNGTAANFFDANVDADGERRWKNVQLPFTKSCSMAQRICKIELMRIRQQGNGTIGGFMSTYKSAPLDVVFFSWAAFGWVNKMVEIQAIRMKTKGDDDQPALSCELDFREADPSVYDWSVTEQLSLSGYSFVPGLQNLSPD